VAAVSLHVVTLSSRMRCDVEIVDLDRLYEGR
jgi:hypothetical protein